MLPTNVPRLLAKLGRALTQNIVAVDNIPVKTEANSAHKNPTKTKFTSEIDAKATPPTTGTRAIYIFFGNTLRYHRNCRSTVNTGTED